MAWPYSGIWRNGMTSRIRSTELLFHRTHVIQAFSCSQKYTGNNELMHKFALCRRRWKQCNGHVHTQGIRKSAKKNFAYILSSLSLHKQVKVLFPKANSNNANKTPRFGLFNLPRRIIVHIDMWHDMTFGQNGCFRKFQKIFLLFEIGQILKRTRSKFWYRPLSHSRICAARRS